ncbi:MAG: 2-oxo acid dehydrogenase subunit E2, partial [Oleispira sp.]|nr:2-oxo acid dehydrogenase subunit E2 [Oleispira sp.]
LLVATEQSSSIGLASGNVAAQQAVAKIEASLPEPLRDQLREISERVSVKHSSVNPLEHHEGAYSTLLRASAEGHEVRIKYESLTECEQISTILRPYQLLFHARSWYAIGKSSLHGEVRTFNVGRVSSAKLLSKTFNVPKSFSLQKYLGNAWGIMSEDGPDQEVHLRFSRFVAKNVAEVLWHSTQKLEFAENGSLDFRVSVSGLYEIVWWVLGYGDQVEVIELLVKVGEEVDAEQSVLTLETDKASMEIPAGKTGRVEKILMTLGDKVSVGDAMIELLVSTSPVSVKENDNASAVNTSTSPATKTALSNEDVKPSENIKPSEDVKPSGKVHAGPAVRKLAREFGVDLALVKGSGARGRVIKDDVQYHVKSTLQNPQMSGSGIPKVAEIDFSKFGDIESLPLNKIKLATAKNLTAAWLNAPQVTQFDQADISELETFRKHINAKPDVAQKLSAVPFIMKALAMAMKEFPQFNASLSADGKSIIYKKYTHIGVAVDTPNGLLVPVIRNVDKKSITEIAQDLTDKAQKARAGKLGLADMQGGCLSVSSLGGIGGTAFTPIVNAPEVAILGLSRAEMKPVWNGSEFVPKLMLPLSLSYDHRVIDGAEAARFSQRLAALLGDIRHLVL